MELKICHLYPDVLNLYGDRGNIICMKKRLEWRGIDCSVSELPIGEKADLGQFDLLFIGGGQDFDQAVLLDDLIGEKSASIKASVEDGRVFLCVCGGYQLMGQYYETHDGVRCGFTGTVDFYTVGAKERMTGDMAFRLGEESGGSVVAGFENHSGRTFLGSGVASLGTVIHGHGNNGQDGGEGVRYKNLFGTYSHGPVLPKNPEFCDFILKTALERKYGTAELAPLGNDWEALAHETALKKAES